MPHVVLLNILHSGTGGKGGGDAGRHLQVQIPHSSRKTHFEQTAGVGGEELFPYKSIQVTSEI